MSIFSYFRQWTSSGPEENAAIRGKYEQLAREHGEVYENRTTELSAPLREYLIRMRKKIVIFAIAFSAAYLLAIVIFALFIPDQLTAMASSMAFLVFAALGGSYMMYQNATRPLKSNEMQVIQGVVTAKEMVDKKGCFLEFSLKEKTQVMPEDYKKTSLGDIIRVEILAKDMLVKRNVTHLGKI